MAVKWLQSAVYPPSRPKLQPGLTRTEVEADVRRAEAARQANGPSPHAWSRRPPPGGKP